MKCPNPSCRREMRTVLVTRVQDGWVLSETSLERCEKCGISVPVAR